MNSDEIKNVLRLIRENCDVSQMEYISEKLKNYANASRRPTQTPMSLVKKRWDIEGPKFEWMQKIFATDFIHLYDDVELDEAREYYVYVHYDSTAQITKARKRAILTFLKTVLLLDHIPFYVGKGKGSRVSNKERNTLYRKTKSVIESQGGNVQTKILFDNLTEKEALVLEAKLIDIFGFVQHGGLLTNLDDGYLPTIRRRMYPYECWKLFPEHIQKELEIFSK